MESMIHSICGALGHSTFLLADDEAFNPLKVGDWPLYFWTVIVFILLLTVLTKFAWGPIMKVVADREQRIGDDIETAETQRREAEELHQQRTKELEAAHQDAKGLLDEARDRAASLRVELERDAREQAEGLVAKARDQIAAEKVQAMQEIRDQVVDLSVEITKQIVEKAVDREDHLRIAEALIPKVRDM